MRVGASSFRVTITWLFGPIVWATHFFLLYGIATVLCTAPAASQPVLAWLLVLGVTVLALIAVASFVTWQFFGWREASRFEAVTAFFSATAIALAGLATVGIIWVAAGAMLVPACANPPG